MLKVKRFTSKQSLNKTIDKLTSKINFKEEYMIKDREYKSYTIDGITLEYAYYEYYDSKYKGYKELSYCTLTNNDIYYLMYDNRGLRAETIIYQLQNYDYLKAENIQDLYSNTYYFRAIGNYKVLNIDSYLQGGSYTIKEKFQALENIQTLKQMMINKSEGIA